MKISEVLKSMGLFSNDIRQRFKNGQIKINGEITNDIELDIKGEILNAGEFLFKLILENKIFGKQLRIFDFEILPDSNLDNELKNILSKFFIIRFSKKDIILVEKN